MECKLKLICQTKPVYTYIQTNKFQTQTAGSNKNTQQNTQPSINKAMSHTQKKTNCVLYL